MFFSWRSLLIAGKVRPPQFCYTDLRDGMLTLASLACFTLICIAPLFSSCQSKNFFLDSALVKMTAAPVAGTATGSDTFLATHFLHRPYNESSGQSLPCSKYSSQFLVQYSTFFHLVFQISM